MDAAKRRPRLALSWTVACFILPPVQAQVSGLPARVPRTEIRLNAPLGFEENRGQAPANIRYVLRPALFTIENGYAVISARA